MCHPHGKAITAGGFTSPRSHTAGGVASCRGHPRRKVITAAKFHFSLLTPRPVGCQIAGVTQMTRLPWLPLTTSALSHLDQSGASLCWSPAWPSHHRHQLSTWLSHTPPGGVPPHMGPPCSKTLMATGCHLAWALSARWNATSCGHAFGGAITAARCDQGLDTPWQARCHLMLVTHMVRPS